MATYELDGCVGNLGKQWKNTCWYHSFSSAFGVCLKLEKVVDLWSEWVEKFSPGELKDKERKHLEAIKNARSLDEENKTPLLRLDSKFMNAVGDTAIGYPLLILFILFKFKIRTLSQSLYLFPQRCLFKEGHFNKGVYQYEEIYVFNPPGDLAVPLSMVKGIWVAVNYGPRYAEHLKRIFTKEKILYVVPPPAGLTRAEIRQMVQVGPHSGTEFDEEQERIILTALQSGRVTAEQVKDAWTTEREGEEYIGGRFLRDKMKDFARKHPEFAGVAEESPGFFTRLFMSPSKAKIIRNAFDTILIEEPHAIAFSPNGIDEKGVATWCYMDSNGWLVENVTKQQIYDFLHDPTMLFVIFELPKPT